MIGTLGSSFQPPFEAVLIQLAPIGILVAPVGGILWAVGRIRRRIRERREASTVHAGRSADTLPPHTRTELRGSMKISHANGVSEAEILIGPPSDTGKTEGSAFSRNKTAVLVKAEPKQEPQILDVPLPAATETDLPVWVRCREQNSGTEEGFLELVLSEPPLMEMPTGNSAVIAVTEQEPAGRLVSALEDFQQTGMFSDPVRAGNGSARASVIFASPEGISITYLTAQGTPARRTAISQPGGGPPLLP